MLLGYASCTSLGSKLLLLPEYLLLHLSVHLLLIEHLLVNHLLLLGGKDVTLRESSTENGRHAERNVGDADRGTERYLRDLRRYDRDWGGRLDWCLDA